MTQLKWNKEFALEQTADDLELLQELLEIFKNSLTEDIHLIRTGISAGDSGQVAGAAHSIKGASSSLGIEGLTEIAKRIEDDSKTGSLVLAGELLPKLELMLAEVKEM